MAIKKALFSRLGNICIDSMLVCWGNFAEQDLIGPSEYVFIDSYSSAQGMDPNSLWLSAVRSSIKAVTQFLNPASNKSKVLNLQYDQYRNFRDSFIYLFFIQDCI